MEQTSIEFITEEDSKTLAAIVSAVPPTPELAFVTFARAAGKNLKTDYRGADLRNYALRRQDLSEVNLEGADLRGADLRGATGYRQQGTLIQEPIIRTGDRRSVFIGSTVLDLLDHREQVRLACQRAGFAPHTMERLPALDEDAIDASMRMVEEADVYIGVFANRYGYVPDGHEISIAEMEYDRAVRLDMPRLIFLSHDDHLFRAKDVDVGPNAQRLKALKDRIAASRVAVFFKSPEDLRSHVVEALSNLKKELDVKEMVDDAAVTLAKLHRQTSIPGPPVPYIASPYTLLQSRDLIGRHEALNVLSDWVADTASKDSDARVFCIVAIGGMGKSALAWKWFRDIAPNEMKPLAGQLWWSFYESDATFERFLTRALCYVSGESEDTVIALSSSERQARLINHLNTEPYLIVLDGLERILVAYPQTDPAIEDDLYEQTANFAIASGLPNNAAQSFFGQHRLRNTADPRAGVFLQQLTQVAKSRVLITTRLYPSALQTPTGRPRPGSFAYFLPGLADDDALSLWRSLNVTGSSEELIPVFRSIENHPLLLQALASEIANYRKAPGDFTQWGADHPHFDPASLPLVQSSNHILRFALTKLAADTEQVLRTIVGFANPASYAALADLLVGADKICATTQELDRSLTELEDRGLIGWDREANRYDVHPIVRGVVRAL
ncbi:DUF4062 domain-containing protein [Bradyrhizobium sp.]